MGLGNEGPDEPRDQVHDREGADDQQIEKPRNSPRADVRPSVGEEAFPDDQEQNARERHEPREEPPSDCDREIHAHLLKAKPRPRVIRGRGWECQDAP